MKKYFLSGQKYIGRQSKKRIVNSNEGLRTKRNLLNELERQNREGTNLQTIFYRKQKRGRVQITKISPSKIKENNAKKPRRVMVWRMD